MDRRGVLDRGCLRNHRLRQNVVDLAQTQVSGPSDMGSDGDSRPIFRVPFLICLRPLEAEGLRFQGFLRQSDVLLQGGAKFGENPLNILF